MTTETKSVFDPVVAAEARKMVAEGLFKRIGIADFPRGKPLYDKHRRQAYFALEGTAAAFVALTDRVRDRLRSADREERAVLLRAMMPV